MKIFKNPLFSVQLLKGNKPARSTLEAHLVNVARLWSNGEGTLPIPTLEAFRLLLTRERHLYRRAHRVAAEKDVLITQELNAEDRPVLILIMASRALPSVVISAKR